MQICTSFNRLTNLTKSVREGNVDNFKLRFNVCVMGPVTNSVQHDKLRNALRIVDPPTCKLGLISPSFNNTCSTCTSNTCRI